MGAPKKNGAYTPLAANYFRDDAILAVGERAEVLYVRCLAFLADSNSDGFITELQLLKYVGLGLTKVQSRIDRLTTEGLLEAIPGGFQVRSWSKWNKTAEEIGRQLKRDRERKANKKAGSDTFSARNPVGFQSDSDPQYTTVQYTTVHDSSSLSEPSDSDAGFSDDVIRLSSLLAELVRANGNRVGTVGKTWWTACDRLIRIDGYTAQQVEWVMRWSQRNEFWQGNILSMPKLREKFDQLKTRALQEASAKKPDKTQKVVDILEMGRQLQEQEDRKALA